MYTSLWMEAVAGSCKLQVMIVCLGDSPISVQMGLRINLFFTFPLMMNPVYEVVERRFCDGSYCIWLRWAVVLAVSLVALMVPNFADFLSLVGSSVCCVLGFALSALFHLIVFKNTMSRKGIAMNVGIMVLGLVFAVYGTYSSLLEIFSPPHRSKSWNCYRIGGASLTVHASSPSHSTPLVPSDQKKTRVLPPFFFNPKEFLKKHPGKDHSPERPKKPLSYLSFLPPFFGFPAHKTRISPLFSSPCFFFSQNLLVSSFSFSFYFFYYFFYFKRFSLLK